jgi:hypothetical protein
VSNKSTRLKASAFVLSAVYFICYMCHVHTLHQLGDSKVLNYYELLRKHKLRDIKMPHMVTQDVSNRNLYRVVCTGALALFVFFVLFSVSLFGQENQAAFACNYSSDCDFGNTYDYPSYAPSYNDYGCGSCGYNSNSYSYQQYPNLQYNYNQVPRSNSSAGQYNYIQYPYPTYTYNQNPGPHDPMADYNNNYKQYPNLVYVYYNQSESSQLSRYSNGTQAGNSSVGSNFSSNPYTSQYANNYSSLAGNTPSTYGNYTGGYGAGNTGFMITSGR